MITELIMVLAKQLNDVVLVGDYHQTLCSRNK